MSKKNKKTDALKLRLTIDRVLHRKSSPAETEFIHKVAQAVHDRDNKEYEKYAKIKAIEKRLNWFGWSVVALVIGAAVITLYYLLK